MSDDVISIQWVPPEYLEENDFNPNVMDQDKFEAMKAEMKEDPAKFWINNQIRVTPRESYFENPDEAYDRFVIIDGAHRWRGAMHLHFKKVPIFIRLLNRAQARRECFRINRQRGTIDPVKEAEMYLLDKGEGVSQDDIARDYGVSKTTVSRAIAITELPARVLGFYRSPEAVFAKYKKLEWENMVADHVNEKILEAVGSYIEAEGVDPSDEEVADMEDAIREHAEKWGYERPALEPDRRLGKSHLELLGTLPTEELQISFALRIMSGDDSLRRLEDQARRKKIMIGLGIYLAILAVIVIAVVLYRSPSTDQGGMPIAQLTPEEIKAALSEPIEKSPNPVKKESKLQDALRLYQQHGLEPLYLHKCLVAFKESLAYGGVGREGPGSELDFYYGGKSGY